MTNSTVSSSLRRALWAENGRHWDEFPEPALAAAREGGVL